MTVGRMDQIVEEPPSSQSLAGESATLYAELQAHLQAGLWVEAIAVCHRILHAEPHYRDVPQLLEEARRQLALSREQSRVATEAWRRTATSGVETSQPHRRGWRLWLLVPALAILVGALAMGIALVWPSGLPRGSTVPTGDQAPTPSQQVTSGMSYYVSRDGRFLLKYPDGWATEESPAEAQSLRVVFITPQASARPGRIAIFFAPGGGQSADQVWISVLGLVQATQDEITEDWLLGEAASTVISGYHARQMPFRYRHIASETDWRGLIVGLTHDSMNYAFILESPAARWPEAWPLFEDVLNSVQFH